MGGFIVQQALDAHRQVLIIIFQISQAWSFTVLYQRDTGKWSNDFSVRIDGVVKSQIRQERENTRLNWMLLVAG